MRLLAAMAVVLVTPSAYAHHEAIFGPQSSLVLSAPGFLSAQVFSRRKKDGVQETTGLVSAGVRPFSSLPISFSLIVPATYSNQPRFSMEDSIVGARYRFDLDALNRATGKDGNFLLGMAALELPTGNTDHPAFDGPLNALGAALASGEVGAFSGILYGFFKQNGPKGADVFSGAGFAWTPWDDPATERLISFQLGLSFERRLPRAGTDGVSRLMAHPTIVWGPGSDLLVFGVVSLPITQRGNPEEQDSYRFGGGVMFLFGGH
jgi:hypothetical protein